MNVLPEFEQAPDDRKRGGHKALALFRLELERFAGEREHVAERPAAVEVRQQRDGVPVDADRETQTLGQLERLAFSDEGALARRERLLKPVARG